MVDVETIWLRLKEHAGEEFQTKFGVLFTYRLEVNTFHPSRTLHQAGKSDFIKALKLVPFDGPGAINKTAHCPAYIYGVLHDSRIGRSDW
jgi:hypothetical protein